MTPPLSSRHKKQTKKESPTTRIYLNQLIFHKYESFFFIESDTTTTTTTTQTIAANKSSTDDNSRRTSLDERILNLLGAPPTSSTEQQLEIRPNPSAQTTSISTPSDKSTESPQDIKSLISTMVKKDRDQSSLTEKLHINEERRSTTSKHYTTEWLASQKPEEAPPTGNS
jgi:hypothetical protein